MQNNMSFFFYSFLDRQEKGSSPLPIIAKILKVTEGFDEFYDRALNYFICGILR